MNNFWNRLEESLKQKNITNKELGDALGITGSTITGWKKGAYPRADIIAKVCKYLGISMDYLFFGRDDIQQAQLEEKDRIIRQLKEQIENCYNNTKDLF